MKRKIISVFLCLVLMVLIGGCGEKKISEFTVGEGTMVLKEIDDDISKFKSNTRTPKGKWVFATFAITKGNVSFGKLRTELITQKRVLLNDQAGDYLIATGVIIKNITSTGFDANQIYCNGTVSVFFDMDTNLNLSSAKVTVDGVTAKANPNAVSVNGQSASSRTSSSSSSSSSTTTSESSAAAEN